MDIGMGTSFRRGRVTVPALLLVVSIILVYWSVQFHGFVNLDDNWYVIDNRHVQGGLSGAGFLWALGSMEVSNWHPLTWLSFMLDYELYGLHAGGYHWTNVLLHLLGAVLLFLAWERMTGARWRSFFVALLFGIHPLHVESVAWIAERKDVLSGLFFMASLWFYAGYVERRVWWRYGLVLVSFILGLMSKPMVVTLPFVLLLLDYWPLGRLREEGGGVWGRGMSLVWEKAPFFVLSAVSCVATYIVQYRGNAFTTLESLSFQARVANAFVSYGRYFLKMVWPADLAFFYPHPESWPVFPVGGAVLFFVSVSYAVLRYRRRYPYAVTGWWWYVGTLVPVIGLVQVGGQAMADRYTYLPLIGLFVMIAWGMGDWALRRGNRGRVMIPGVVAPVAIMALMLSSLVQTGYWRDSGTLFEHALKVTKDNYLAHNNLGLALLDQEKFDEAGRHFSKAIRIKPNYAPLYNNFGFALTLQGRGQESLVWYQRALQINPDNVGAHFNLAESLSRLGRLDDAASHYRQAMNSQPDNPLIHNNLGVVLTRKGTLDQAAAEYRAALRIDPRHAGAHNNLAMLLLPEGREEEAIWHFRQALAIQPDFANAHYHLALALERKGFSREADTHFRAAARINALYGDKRPVEAGNTHDAIRKEAKMATP